MTNQTYAQPAAYDLAFSYRDYAEEVSTLIEWFTDTSESDRAPHSVLELAAGPGRHALEFSQRGIDSVALDLTPEMSRYCQALAVEGCADLEVITADMISFELNREFDLILTLINSVCHILDEEQLVRHFNAVEGHLADGGLYVIEATRNKLNFPPGKSQWIQQAGNDVVDVSWSWDHDFDYVQMSGKVHGQEFNVIEQFPMRRWRSEELVGLASESNLELVGYSGDFDDDRIDSLELGRRLENRTTMHGCFVFGKR
ncbi:MAG: class I SAM-dependent methyltransferase [Pseudomonadales bacterium]